MNNRYTKLLKLAATALTVVSLSTAAHAQDPQFSQFFNTPLRMNPAMTGVFNGSYRVAFNYRDQWSSVLGSTNAFRTYAAAADMNAFVMKTDLMGFGIQALRDEAGEGRFGHTNVMLSGSYVKQLSGRKRGWKQASHFLSGGLQLGMGQNSIDWNRFRFSTQYYTDASGVTAHHGSAPSGENLDKAVVTYVDLNAGLMWYALLGEHTSIYAGGSANHVNQPNIGFLGKTEPLFMRYSANVGGEFPLSRTISLLPSVMYWKQGPASQVEVGMNLRYSNRDWRELVLKAGIWDRLPGDKAAPIAQDALILFAGIDYERWAFGFSYDLNQSGLQRVSNTRGAYEISAMYIHPPKRRLGVACPRFR
jgi:type IX secretion system PorP/SprF family membrane protein